MNALPSSRFAIARRLLAVVVVSALLLSGAAAARTTAGPAVGGGDAPDERSNAEPLAAGETIESNLSEGEDVDWYAVDVTAGDAVIAELYALNTTNRSIRVRVYDAGGANVTQHRADQMCGPDNEAGETSCGTRARAVAPTVAEANGTYFVEVSKSDDVDANRSREVPYNLTVRTHDLDRYDPNQNGTTATPIDLGERIHAVGAIFDQDVYAVDLAAGVNYTITVNTTETREAEQFSKRLLVSTDAASVVDPRWDDPGGRNYTAGTDRFTRDERLTFTAERDGTHYVVLGQSSLGYALLEEDTYSLTIARTDDGADGSNEADESGGADGTASDDATPTGTGSAAPDDGSTATPEDDASVTPTATTEDEAAPTDDAGTASPKRGTGASSPGSDGGTTADPSAATGTADDAPGAGTQTATDVSGPGFGAPVAVCGVLAVALGVLRRRREVR